MGLSIECEKALDAALEQLAAGEVDQLGFDIATFSSEADRRLLGHVEAIHTLYKTTIAQNERFSVGDFEFTNGKQSGQVWRSTAAVGAMLADVVEQADIIARGDFDADIRPRSKQDKLGIALQSMTQSLRSVAGVCEKIAAGDTSEKVEIKGDRDLLGLAVNQVVDTLKDAAEQADIIARGDFDADIRPRSEQDKLGIALQSMTQTLRNVACVCEKIAAGDTSEKVEIKGDRDLLGLAVNQVVDTLKDAAEQADLVARGDFMADREPRSEQDKLGIALKMMTEALRNDHWLKNGRGATLEKLRGEQDIANIAESVLAHLAKYVGAQTGIFYVANDRGTMSLISSYACAHKKTLRKEFALGEGMLGQAVLEQQAIENMDISSSPIGAAHGGGELSLTNLGIFPLCSDGKIQAAIQFASIDPLSESALDLIRSISENIAIAISTANSRGKMQAMLEESQRQGEEMQQQGEQLRAANEEMEEQTKRLKRSEEELKSERSELQAINEELEEKTEHLQRQKAEVVAKHAEVEKAKVDLSERAADLEAASKYKSEFLANMSHELRTPLNSLLILSKGLAENDEGNLTEAQVESANIIFGGGEDLLTLINDILDLSKVEAGKLEIDIGATTTDDIVRGMKRQFTPVANSKNLDFRIEREKGINTDLRTDDRRVSQILKNLLSNAFKFTTEGSVTLKVESPKGGLQFRNSTLQPDNVIALSVKDTGIGIRSDKQRDIFEAFQQADGSTSRNYGGTGLGLTISRELTKLLGGELQLESSEGVGSTFTLYLPITGPVAATNGPPAAKSDNVHRRSTPIPCDSNLPPLVKDDRETITEGDTVLLLVEDDAGFARTLMQIVRAQGHKCVVAGQGNEALKLAMELLPDGIILDMGLPDLSGLQVLEQLKFDLRTRHIPVHVVSADDKTMAAELRGAIGYLQKPASKAQLEGALKSLEEVWGTSAKRVLVIEDHEPTRNTIAQVIGSEDIEITEAGTAAEAFALISSGNFDCAILDLGLPDADGTELLRRLREAEFSLPVVVYTGRDLDKAQVADLRDYSANIVLKNAKSPEHLLDEVSLFLHSVEGSLPEKQRTVLRMLHNPNAALQDRKVLVVDDDLRNVFALTGVLQKQGMTVVKAENGQVALDTLEAESGIDIVVMDIMMPIMDGYEAIQRIRANPRFSDLPIIALTAKAMPADRQACLEAGASDYLTKPLDPENLISLMRVLFFDWAAA